MGIIYIKTTDILFQHTIPYAQSHALYEKYSWQLLYHGEGFPKNIWAIPLRYMCYVELFNFCYVKLIEYAM